MKNPINTIFLLIYCSLLCLSTNAQNVQFSTSSSHKSYKLDGVASHTQILDLELQNLKLLKSKEGGLNFNLQINKENSWDLALEETQIISDQSQIRLLNKGSELKVPVSNIATYSGHLKDKTNTSVALTISDNYFSLMINDGVDIYIIEPLSIYEDKALKSQFVFYKAKDIHPDNSYECKRSDLLSEISNNATLTKSNNLACYDVELAIVVDYIMYSSEGSSINNVLNTLASIYNLVSLDFDNEFNHQLNIRIKEVVISVCAACDQWSTTNNVGHALDAIRDWGENGGFNETYDIGIFWTSRVYDDNFAGLAYQDQICGVQRYIAVRKYTANTQSLRIMMSHEIGHSFGCGHNFEIGSACDNNPGRGPKIMDPIVDPNSIGWTIGTLSCDLNSTAVVNAKITSATCLQTCQNISCSSVTNLNVTGVNQGGMNVSWSGSAGSYQVRVKEEGASVYSYNSNTNSTNISINTSLEYCKQYHVSVKSLCGGGASPAAITEIVEISGGTAMQILYVEPKNCDAGSYDLEVVVAYENTVPGGFRVVANGASQVFSYTSSPQTVNVIGLNSANNNNASLEAFGVTNSGPACYGSTNYAEPNASCEIVISEYFNDCEMPFGWNATSSNSSVFSENFEWKFNDGNRTILNYGAANNASTHKTINGTCAAYFDDDIFMNSTYTGSITLESRAYDLTNMSDVSFEVDYNFHNFSEGKMTSNSSEFSIDIFNGTNWVNVMFDDDDSCPWFNVWANTCTTTFALDVTAYASSQFKVRFNYTDGNSGDWTGMVMLDNFKVIGTQLPVLDLKILNFSGELDEHKIGLEWDIEIDNSFSHYAIHHSSNGELFKELVELQYSSQYTDNQPTIGNNYYKLYMYDQDGKFVESNTIMIEYKPTASLNLYPNPTNSDKVYLVNTTDTKYDQLKVFDISGRELTSELLVDQMRYDIDIADYRKGVYLIQLSNTVSAKTLRLVKL